MFLKDFLVCLEAENPALMDCDDFCIISFHTKYYEVDFTAVNVNEDTYELESGSFDSEAFLRRMPGIIEHGIDGLTNSTRETFKKSHPYLDVIGCKIMTPEEFSNYIPFIDTDLISNLFNHNKNALVVMLSPQSGEIPSVEVWDMIRQGKISELMCEKAIRSIAQKKVIINFSFIDGDEDRGKLSYDRLESLEDFIQYFIFDNRGKYHVSQSEVKKEVSWETPRNTQDVYCDEFIMAMDACFEVFDMRLAEQHNL